MFIFPPFIIIVPILLSSFESGSDFIPSLSLAILIVPPLIVIILSQAKAFLAADIVKVPLFIVNEDSAAPLIPFFGFPTTVNFPEPLIVKDELDLNLIPAPSKPSESSLFISSLSNIVDSPTNTKLTSADLAITKGPLIELSIYIEFK